MTTPLGQALTLPCGLVLPNRIAKAALSEFMADADGVPSEDMVALYRQWGEGGAGLLITGNVMVDPRYPEAPGNVVLNGRGSNLFRKRLAAVAEAGKLFGAAVMMQLSHAGALASKFICDRPVAPSLKKRGASGFGALSSSPCRAMTSDEINNVIDEFVTGAEVALEAGFDGVQILSGHGHLISQFLSPMSNKRTDEWGGPLHNRARLLLKIIEGVRAKLPDSFAVSVKLNATDFVENGFEFDDCRGVVEWLNCVGIDLIEVSGGNRANPHMFGFMRSDNDAPDGRLVSGFNETGAYFGGFSKAVKSVANVPVMVTGGVRRREDAERIIMTGVADAVGFGRPMCLDTRLAYKLLSGEADAIEDYMPDGLMSGGHLGFDSKFGVVRNAYFEALIAWHVNQMSRLPDGLKGNAAVGPITATRHFRKRIASLRSD